jgi:hypothetical protein
MWFVVVVVVVAIVVAVAEGEGFLAVVRIGEEFSGSVGADGCFFNSEPNSDGGDVTAASDCGSTFFPVVGFFPPFFPFGELDFAMYF